MSTPHPLVPGNDQLPPSSKTHTAEQTAGVLRGMQLGTGPPIQEITAMTEERRQTQTGRGTKTRSQKRKETHQYEREHRRGYAMQVDGNDRKGKKTPTNRKGNNEMMVDYIIATGK